MDTVFSFSLALGGFGSALIFGLMLYFCNGNLRWAKLNDDGKTVLVGGYLSLLAGMIGLILYALKLHGVIE